LVSGFLLIAAGTAALNAPSNLGGMLATTVFGCGLGLTVSAINLWVAEVARDARVAAVSFVNFVWGLGAISCPPLVMLAERHHRLPEFLYAVAASSAIVALVLGRMNVEPQVHSEAVAAGAPAPSPVSREIAVSLAAMFYLYVGCESAVSGWVAALAKRVDPAGGDLWALAPMFFWAGLLGGRGLLPLIPQRRHERAVVIAGIAWAVVWIILLARAETYAGVVACAGLAAVGFAGVYPILIAWLVKIFGDKSRRVGALMFALADLGGATMPWLVGVTSTRAESLRAGLVVPLAACAAMLVTLAMMRDEIFRGTSVK
jgi:fucose permease